MNLRQAINLCEACLHGNYGSQLHCISFCKMSLNYD